MKRTPIILLLIFLFSFLAVFQKAIFATKEEDLLKQIAEYQGQIENLQKKADSLSKEIALIDYQIKITTLRISQTQNQIKTLENEIARLSVKIENLDDSLNYLSKVLLSRVAETYKNGRTDPLILLISSDSFSDFISRFRYLQAVQLHDREMLLSMEQTRTSYDEQKQLKEQKQKELEDLGKKLEVQKNQLNSQVLSRKRLLDETRGQEKNYQRLLAEAREELEAILGILAGKGREVEVKSVSEGERIASVIAGPSCNSSGTHLHFMVAQDGQTKNPFGHLKGGIDFENCSGSICGSADGDAFNPSGDWNWPLNPRVKLTQGYGNTWAVQHFSWLRRIYDFHNGIDIQGATLEVKSVKPGKLFLGSYVGSCTLRYVRVQHNDGGYDSYYLHVNY